MTMADNGLSCQRNLFCWIILSCLYPVLCQRSASGAPTAAPPLKSIYSLSLDEQAAAQSQNYPQSCCEFEKVTIRLDPSKGPGYIHLTFDDLDLPLGTNFKIYKEENEEPSNMFRDQPDFKLGSWKRPVLVSSSVIYMVVRPRNSSEGAYRGISTKHAGFRATFTVSRNEVPHFQYTSDLCPGVPSILAGDKIRVKPQPLPKYNNMWLDCLWLIKPPPPKAVNPQRDVRPYIRFDDLFLTRGKVYVHEGTHSLGRELAAGKELADLHQGAGGILSDDARGFYVRAVLPADDRQSRLSFVYGYVYYGERRTSCMRGHSGFACDPPYGQWCVPGDHVCNGVENCPRGEEEVKCGSYSAPPTQRTSTARPPTTTSPNVDGHIVTATCSSFEKYCAELSSCITYYEVCPGACPTGQKRCDDGNCIPVSKYCLEEACPQWQSLRCGDSVECYSYIDQCDSIPDCSNDYDEQFCVDEPGTRPRKGHDSNLFFLLIVPFAVCIGALLCCKYYKRKGRQNGTAGAASTENIQFTDVAHRPSPRPSPRLNASSRSSPATSRRAYSAVSVNVPESDLSPPPDSTAPPSYDEVTNATSRSVIRPTDEPPPPSYDRAIQGPQIHFL